MYLPRSSTRDYQRMSILFLLLVSLVAVPIHSQQDTKSEEWLTVISNKHGITYDSFTQCGDFFIIGEKGNVGELETYNAATVIEKGSEGYWILKSERVSFDPNSTTLKICDCIMEKFKNNSKSLDPLERHKHINVTINITERTSTMLPANQGHTK